MGTGRKSDQKIIIILGPTSSGKSDLAVWIAKKIEKEKIGGFNGAEIVSADSRQVYKGMDIGSGKVTKKEMQGIPHHLIDVASPKRRFSVAQYQKIAQKEIEKILFKNKVPVLCGGSAFYIKAVVKGLNFPKAVPDWDLRKKLDKKNTEKLYQMLKKLDPQRAESVEKNNPRRLIRALEIVLQTKKPVSPLESRFKYLPLIIGINHREKDLKKKIEKRLEKRIKKGMMAEVKRLKKSGISWKRLESFGLEYRWAAKYLQGKISYKEMKECLLRDIIKFSKKQMAWWKNDEKIKWIKTKNQAENLVKDFLKLEKKN